MRCDGMRDATRARARPQLKMLRAYVCAYVWEVCVGVGVVFVCWLVGWAWARLPARPLRIPRAPTAAERRGPAPRERALWAMGLRR